MCDLWASRLRVPCNNNISSEEESFLPPKTAATLPQQASGKAASGIIRRADYNPNCEGGQQAPPSINPTCDLVPSSGLPALQPSSSSSMAIDMEVASSGGSGDLSIDALSALSDAAAAAIPALQSQSQSHHQAAPTDTSALQQKDQLGMAEQAVNADMQVEHEQATGASTRNDIPHTQASSPKSAASSTPSMLARPAGLAGTPAAAAGHAPVATDLTGFSHRPSTGSTQQEHASTSINSPPASHPGASYAENSNPADAASAAAAALAKANNGSSASVLSTGSSSKGRSHSPDSSVKGNLKRELFI